VSYTLTTLRDKVKRRIRVLRASSPTGTEVEVGAFSNDTVDDAINAGRKQIMVVVRNAELWGKTEAVFVTVADVQEYSLGGNVLRIDGVQYNVDSDGDQNSNTYNAIDVETTKGENRVLNDPMDIPSATNPKYRITNRGIKLIVSTNGTVTVGVYIRVEYLKELIDMTAITDTSGLTGTLDELVIDWAIWVLCQFVMPQLAQMVREQFYNQAMLMNRSL